MSKPDYAPVEGTDASEVPVRILVVQDEALPATRIREEAWVMTFPHLLVREAIAAVALTLVLVAISLIFDAPLEELANAQKTPNPSKAPWYFLGLQELLHYYPPLVSGVLLPGALVASLIVIPYFNVNIERAAFWRGARAAKLLAILVAVAATTAVFYFTGAHPVWPLVGTTWFIGLLMLLPGVFGPRGKTLRWLGTRSLALWLFSWFIVAATVLTLIGVYFRGPGWSFTIPWRDGIF